MMSTASKRDVTSLLCDRFIAVLPRTWVRAPLPFSLPASANCRLGMCRKNHVHRVSINFCHFRAPIQPKSLMFFYYPNCSDSTLLCYSQRFASNMNLNVTFMSISFSYNLHKSHVTGSTLARLWSTFKSIRCYVRCTQVQSLGCIEVHGESLFHWMTPSRETEFTGCSLSIPIHCTTTTTLETDTQPVASPNRPKAASTTMADHP